MFARIRNSSSRSPSSSAMRRASASMDSAVSGSARHPRDTPSVVVAWSSQNDAGGSQARATRIASRARRSASEKVPSSIRSWARPATTRARAGVAVAGTRSTDRRRAASPPSKSPAPRRKCPSRSKIRPSLVRSRRASSLPTAASRYAAALVTRPAANAASAARIPRSADAVRAAVLAARADRRARVSPAAAPDAMAASREVSSSIGASTAAARSAASSAARLTDTGSWAARWWCSATNGWSAIARATAAWWRIRTDGRRSPSMARPTSSWRSTRPCASSTTNPYSIASSRPAVRSASSTPSPRRGPLDERGGALVASSSNDSAIAASIERSSGRPAGASRRRTRRASGDRTAIRARTRSSKLEVSDTAGSSRRAASSSSATSGRPPDRSTTTTSTLADGRASSIDSMRRARSSRPSGPEAEAGRAPRGRGQRGEIVRPGIVAADRIGLVGADDRQALDPRDPGQEGDEGPGAGVGPMEVLHHEQHGSALPQPTDRSEDALQEASLAPFSDGPRRSS